MFILATEGMQPKNAIAVYKGASGACLNLKKSVVIPFGVCDLPLWLVNSGCMISPPGTVQKYLWAPWGTGLEEEQLMDFCLERIGSRLSAWSSRSLSFTGRTLLIRYVLQTIPIFQMMFIHIPKKAGLQMIRLFGISLGI